MGEHAHAATHIWGGEVEYIDISVAPLLISAIIFCEEYRFSDLIFVCFEKERRGLCLSAMFVTSCAAVVVKKTLALGIGPLGFDRGECN